MREILFRGKCGYNNEWVEGFYYQAKLYRSDKELCHYITIPHPDCDGQPSDHIMVNPETVGQFTGLTDKNGKRIFESDIVKIPDDYEEFGINAGEIYEVYFAFGGFRLKPKYSKANGFWLEDDATVEIIGNIHDNPELLKEE